MKSKQVLDVQQMQHLQELGLDTTNASMYWISYNGISVSIPSNFHLPTSDNDYVICDAYTLQDVLDALPLQVEIPLHPECGKYEIRIKRMVFNTGKVMHAVVYEKSDYIDWFVLHSHEKLIDAAYEMLCWAIENKFVETNKNE